MKTEDSFIDYSCKGKAAEGFTDLKPGCGTVKIFKELLLQKVRLCNRNGLVTSS